MNTRILTELGSWAPNDATPTENGKWLPDRRVVDVVIARVVEFGIVRAVVLLEPWSFVAFGVPVGIDFVTCCGPMLSFQHEYTLQELYADFSDLSITMKYMDKDHDKRPIATKIIETITVVFQLDVAFGRSKVLV
ncbi:hypothetical protein C2G38_2180468 [Gigaspora rosea]|uniref:Uncharacterized protein n=1 Tax=Gigaspora rosea TaxID=44941 RepID=A0A397VG41_9GLOM|nr:hypothetical protein C2G38_2180468 [Gigaspora rosea]